LITVYLSARGYEVLEAPTGRAAIETAITGNPNFILLDLRLPDVSGVEVARELRKLPQTEHIPIVGWTADCGSKPYEEVLRRAGIIGLSRKAGFDERTRGSHPAVCSNATGLNYLGGWTGGIGRGLLRSR
jgi:CheY-like chemotaxis protein